MSRGQTQAGKARLVVLQTHPIQYYAPLYRALAQRGRIQVKVIYLSDVGVRPHPDPGFDRQVVWDVPLLEGYDFLVLQAGKAIAGTRFWNRRDSRLTDILDRERPDWLLVYGYASLINWQAVAWAGRHGARVAYCSDTNIRLMRSGLRTAAKKFVLKRFLGRIDAFFSPGEANYDYLRFFDVEPAKIVWCPFAIDTARFVPGSARAGDAPVDLVWAGKMIAVKRPLDFVFALQALVKRGRVPVKASMIGSGPLLETVREAAGSLVAQGLLELRGFVNQSEMPAELGRGRIFVFSSEHDQYGVAATEAAACGLALIVADINGCVGEHASARPGSNALTYPAGDVGALADCMEKLLTDSVQLQSLREASRAIAAEHDLDRAASIVESAIDARQWKDHANPGAVA